MLIAQDYSDSVCELFIRDVIPIMQNPRYIRVDGAPMLLVYRVNVLPDPAAVAKRWREICRQSGVGAIHLCAVQSFGITDPREYGFDAAVEFPPHSGQTLIDPASFPGVHPDFEGSLVDYSAIVRHQIAMPWPEYLLYRGVMPAWDNTPRRGTKAYILVHSSPELYEEWLYHMIKQSLQYSSGAPFIFINAWNEWAEGAYLEPDQRLGYARLAATQNAIRRASLSTHPGERPADLRG